MISVYFLSCVITLLSLIYWWMVKTYNRWSKSGIPHRQPIFFFGTLKDSVMGVKARRDVLREIYTEGIGHPYIGMFDGRRPVLLLRDPDVIRKVLQTDYEHFTWRIYEFLGVHGPTITKQIIFCEHEIWKRLRSVFSPAFTSSKAYCLISVMNQCATNLINNINDELKKNNDTEVQLESKIGRYTVEISAKVNLGIQFHDGSEPIIQSMTNIWGKTPFVEKVQELVGLTFTSKDFCEKLPFSKTNTKCMNQTRALIRELIDEHTKNDIKTKDILQFLLEAKSQDKTGLLDNNTIVANQIIFFWGVYESSTTLLTAALYSLATNPRVQTKLRNEVIGILNEHKGPLNQDHLQNMPYLHMFISEVLRLYPSFAELNRSCTKTYRFDDKLTLVPGEAVSISIHSLHRDPHLFPEPEKFIPERFSDEEKNKRHPFAYIPFGGGPRYCLGNKLALTQAKVLLARLVSTFLIEPSKKTSELKFHPKYISLTLSSPVYLSFKPL